MRAAIRLSSGDIVVADGLNGALHWYSGRGAHLRTLGGAADDRARFSSVDALHRLPGDEFLAWHPVEARLSTFSARGELVRSLEFPSGELSLFPQLAGILGPGELLLRTDESRRFDVALSPRRAPFTLLRYSFDTGRLDTLRQEPGTEQLTWRIARGAARMPLPLAHHTAVAVEGGRVWIADSAEERVRVYGTRGAPEAAFDVPADGAEVTEEEKERLRRRFELDGQRLSGERAGPEYMENVRIPGRYPSIGALRVDGAGNAWIQGMDPARAHVWAVFDPSGRRLAEVHLPEPLDILEIGQAYLLTKTRDENHPEEVRLYRLRR